MPGEYFDLVEASESRREREQKDLAWLAATIINGVGNRRRAVRMEDLLPKRKRVETRSGGEIKQDWESLKKTAGATKDKARAKKKSG